MIHIEKAIVLPHLPAAALLHLAVDALLSVVLGLFTVKEVQTLGLELAVDESTSKTGSNLLGSGVVLNLAVLGLVVLVGLHGLEGGGTTDQLVGELGLVFLRGLRVLLVVLVVTGFVRLVVEPTHDERFEV